MRSIWRNLGLVINESKYQYLDLSEYPQDWSIDSIEELILTQFSGKSPQCESFPALSTEWGYLKTNSIKWDGFDPTKNKALTPELESDPNLEVKKNDIIITKAGPRHRVGVVVHVRKTPPLRMISGKMILLRSNSKKINPKFLSLMLSSNPAQFFLDGRTTGMAESQVNFMNKEFLKVPILYPSLPEQQKIAAILSSVDDTIEKTRIVIQKTERVKKGLMQQLLTKGIPGWHSDYKETKLGVIPKCWKVKKLGNMLIRSQYGISESLQIEKTALPILRMGNIQNGKLDLSLKTLKYLQNDKIPEFQDYVLNDGDILFNRTNSMELVGKIAIFENQIKCSFASYLIRLEPDKASTLPYYLNFYLNLTGTQSKIKRLATPGVSQANVNVENLKKFILAPQPSIVEQEKIINILLSLIMKENQLKIDLEKHKKIKIGLIQQLLTGKIRVKV